MTLTMSWYIYGTSMVHLWYIYGTSDRRQLHQGSGLDPGLAANAALWAQKLVHCTYMPNNMHCKMLATSHEYTYIIIYIYIIMYYLLFIMYYYVKL